MHARALIVSAICLVAAACDDPNHATSPADAGTDTDTGRDPGTIPKSVPDASKPDSSPPDAAPPDASPIDPSVCDQSESCPDLVLEASDDPYAVRFNTITVPADDCRLYEGCVRGSGQRSLLEIGFVLRNVGDGALALGAPWSSALFYESLCQDDYLFDGLFEAKLYAGDAEVAAGQLSTACISREDGSFDCAMQGLAPNEGSAQPKTSCNFLDVTGVAPGEYVLELRVNPRGALAETRFDNNTLRVNVEVPVCDGTVCGDTCCPSGVACRDGTCMVPDLRISREAAEESLTIAYRGFGENACEIEEACVGGPGRRRLLMFEGRVENWGPGDLNPGPEANNPLFEYSMCHDHYHFKGISSYRLVDDAGNVFGSGHKQSYCLVNMDPVGGEGDAGVDPAPWGTHPEPGPTGCNYLAAGWADIYGVGTPCQWVDITGVPEGDYTLELAVNPDGRISELATENNLVRIPYHVPAEVPCVPTTEECDSGEDEDCDGLTDYEDTDDCEQPCWDEGQEYCGDAYDNDCDGEIDDGCQVTPGGETCAEAIVVGDAAEADLLLELAPQDGEALSSSCAGDGAAVYVQLTLEQESIVYLRAQEPPSPWGDGASGHPDGHDGHDGHAHADAGTGSAVGSASGSGRVGTAEGWLDGGAGYAGDGGSYAWDGGAGPERLRTSLSLFAGSCEAESELACEAGSCRYGNVSQLVRKLPAGTYTVLVRADSGGAAARVSLHVERLSAEGIEVVTEPGLYAGSTAGAVDAVTVCGEYEGGPDRTYVVAMCPNASITASTCGMAEFESALEIRGGSGGYNPCSYSDNQCAADPNGATVTQWTYSATLVRVMVDSNSSEQAGNYELLLSY